MTKDYVVRAMVAPDGKLINKGHSHGEDKDAAFRHYTLLKRKGWKAEIELLEEGC